MLLIPSEMQELVEGADRILVLHDGAVVCELGGADVAEGQVLRAIAGAGSSADVAGGERR